MAFEMIDAAERNFIRCMKAKRKTDTDQKRAREPRAVGYRYLVDRRGRKPGIMEDRGAKPVNFCQMRPRRDFRDNAADGHVGGVIRCQPTTHKGGSDSVRWRCEVCIQLIRGADGEVNDTRGI